MYYEERYIEGKWYYRTSRMGKWHELYVSALTEKVSELKRLRKKIIATKVHDLNDAQRVAAIEEALCL